MVEAKWLMLFLVSALIRGSALHPMAQALSRSDSSDSSGSSEEDHSVPGLSTLPLHPLEGNYISYSDDYDKRGPGKNFLRFGKSGGPPMASALYAPILRTEEEKRAAARNFLRFGRNPERNFLRFGKSTPLGFGLGLEGESSEEFMKRANANNFFRYGKAADRNYIRFGRSTKSQNGADCKGECSSESDQPSSQITSNFPSSGSQVESKRDRQKRSVSAFYDDVEFMPWTPTSWTSEYASALPESVFVGRPTISPPAGNDQKRSYNRSFLRYGRDPLDLHFLRYGKRGSLKEEKTSPENNGSVEGFARSMPKNFIRFG